MAVANLEILNEGDKVYRAARAIGEGAIAAGDRLVTDKIWFDVGSEYFDTTNRILYRRLAFTGANGAIGDWCKTAALTVHS